MKFKKNSLTILLTFVHAFLLLYGIYPLIAGMAQLQGRSALTFCLTGLLLFVPVVLSWWLLRRLHRLWLYLPIGILISAVCGFAAYLPKQQFLYGREIACGATAFASLLLFVSHASARIKHGNLKKDFIAAHGANVPFKMKVWEVPTLFSNPIPAHLAWFVCQYALGLILRATLYWRFIFFLTVADIFVLFSYRYLSRLDEFILENQKTASLPVLTIKKIHRILFVIALLLILLFTLPAVFYGREPLAESSEYTSPPIEISEESDGGNYSGTINYDPVLPPVIAESNDQIEPPVWIGYVVKAMLFILFAVFIIVLIIAIYHAIRHASENFAVENEDEIVFLDSGEDDQRTRTRKKKKPHEGLLSPNMQIRRRYKKTIKKSTEGIPDSWATPTELEIHAGLNRSDEMQKLHLYYEKARYSREGCTKEDLRQL